MIAHLLSTIPYEEVRRAELKIPHRPPATGYRQETAAQAGDLRAGPPLAVT